MKPKDFAFLFAIVTFGSALIRNIIVTNNANSYVNSGMIKSENGDHLGAIGDFTSAINIQPKNTQILLLRGISKRKSNNDVDAIKKQGIKEKMVTLRRDGVNKILHGLTTAEEILSITSEEL